MQKAEFDSFLLLYYIEEELGTVHFNVLAQRFEIAEAIAAAYTACSSFLQC